MTNEMFYLILQFGFFALGGFCAFVALFPLTLLTGFDVGSGGD